MFIANLTTKEYIICDEQNMNNKLTYLYPKIPSMSEILKSMNFDTHYRFEDSRWLINDKVVFVPKHCEEFVRREYSLVC